MSKNGQSSARILVPDANENVKGPIDAVGSLPVLLHQPLPPINLPMVKEPQRRNTNLFSGVRMAK